MLETCAILYNILGMRGRSASQTGLGKPAFAAQDRKWSLNYHDREMFAFYTEHIAIIFAPFFPPVGNAAVWISDGNQLCKCKCPEAKYEEGPRGVPPGNQ